MPTTEKKAPAIRYAIDVLALTQVFTALHEFSLIGVSESALGARLREEARSQDPRVYTRRREGKHYNEWGLIGWRNHAD